MLATIRAKSSHFFQWNLFFIVKRVADIILSSILIIVFSPLFLWISYILSKKEGSPVFYKELCLGKNKKPFTLWSFRTMTHSSKVIRCLPPHPFPSTWDEGVPDKFRFTRDSNTAYTMTGLKLRKYHLDRLPQLWNVLKGDMSFIGPSPEVLEVADYYNRQQAGRLQVKPGLTGYAQIHGLTNENHKEKIKYDLSYIEQASIKLECKIYYQTIKQLWSK